MNMEKNPANYRKELKAIFEQLETFLKVSPEIKNNQKLKELLAFVHNIDEVSTLFGLNNLSGLFSVIEKHLSNAVVTNEVIGKEKLTIILSAVSMSYAILDDPELKKPGIKTNVENLKKQIGENFKGKNQKTDENAFSNSRFQEIFVDEANDLINQLEEKLLQLESEPDDTTLVDNVFRIMHTLKGNSNMFGFKHLGEITHHLENIYDAIRSHKLDVSPSILETTLQCIDHFRNMIEDPELLDQTNKVIQESILNDIAEIMDPGEVKIKTNVKTKSVSDGIHTFYLFFDPTHDIFDDGSNPLFYVFDLNDIGECLIIPKLKEIASGKYNPDKAYTSWHILIATKENKDVLLDNFMFLRDDCQPAITIISNSNLLGDKNFVDRFKEYAKENVSIADKLSSRAIQESEPHTEEKSVVRAKMSQSDTSIASIRVASAKVDLMMNLISELVTKQAELSMLANNQNITQLQEVAESIESISRDLRDNAFSISLIPLDKTVLRFQRLVRDVSAKFEKQVDFIIEGKETELDKTIIEKIVDPIMHILRNSIDHGIESPEKRRQLGKPEHGTITLKAYPSGAHVVIEITDDGSGINVEKVKQTAIRRGYIGSHEDLTTDEMLKLILSPGFTTADNVSEVSGRGVGMDVVYQKISEIRGELNIHTEANIGTTIIIKLPLTISIIDSLLVMLGSTFYLIPLSVVQRCAEVKTVVITESPTNYINLDGEFIPFIDLHQEFEIQEERTDYQRLIMVNHKGLSVALVVDQIVGNHQAVLKALGQVYKKQEIISGASILGNGDVALVLDTNRLLQEYMALREEELNKANLLSMKVS